MTTQCLSECLAILSKTQSPIRQSPLTIAIDPTGISLATADDEGTIVQASIACRTNTTISEQASINRPWIDKLSAMLKTLPSSDISLKISEDAVILKAAPLAVKMIRTKQELPSPAMDKPEWIYAAHGETIKNALDKAIWVSKQNITSQNTVSFIPHNGHSDIIGLSTTTIYLKHVTDLTGQEEPFSISCNAAALMKAAVRDKIKFEQSKKALTALTEHRTLQADQYGISIYTPFANEWIQQLEHQVRDFVSIKEPLLKVTFKRADFISTQRLLALASPRKKRDVTTAIMTIDHETATFRVASETVDSTIDLEPLRVEITGETRVSYPLEKLLWYASKIDESQEITISTSDLLILLSGNNNEDEIFVTTKIKEDS